MFPGWTSSQRTRNGLRAAVVVECFRTVHPAAQTAQVHPAVRQAIGKNIVSIYPAITGNKMFGQSIGTLEIAAPDAVRETISQLVNLICHRLLVLELDEIRARSK